MIYDNELKEARKKLDKLAEQREEMNTRQSKVSFKFQNYVQIFRRSMLKFVQFGLNFTFFWRFVECLYLQVTNDLLNAQNRALQASAEQRKLEARFKGMREEKEALLAEQTERVQRKTELELLINDLREDVEKERFGRVS